MERVTQKRVAEIIRETDIQIAEKGEKTTILFAQLPNGYEVVESAHAANPTDYDRDMGRSICLNELRSTVAEYLAFQNHDDL